MKLPIILDFMLFLIYAHKHFLSQHQAMQLEGGEMAKFLETDERNFRVVRSWYALFMCHAGLSLRLSVIVKLAAFFIFPWR